MHPVLRSFALTVAIVASSADAGELVYFNEGQIPDPARIATLLAAPRSDGNASAAGPDASAQGGRTRTVRLLDATTAPATIAAPVTDRPRPIRPAPAPASVASVASVDAPRVASAGAIALALRFSFDSSEVHPSNYAQLDAVAAGIKRLPEGAVVSIAGHTDAFGAPAYNLDLSLKRASAVRNYLIRVHGIPRQAIVAMGKGKSEPYNRANPYAPENRRVQIHAEYDVATLPESGGARLLPNS